ncbi:hypothetical protein TERTU_1398 [Teredinibacter turnerae T7901]|uniref:Uncharacterized protein n=1 Tax=Teredinibacter turnerae (strain ATCC 39867 / T7901) TaxID=377629 RepID=C5BSK4_TERTT|nr:hypothetical protein TERTU_1398 [Teredinibacter turnerae T7901]
MYLLLFLVKLLFIQQKLAFRQFLLRNAPHGGASGALPLVALGAPPVAASGNGLRPAGEGKLWVSFDLAG